MRTNVIIPMAGAGSRFQKAGYTFPKPLIEVYRGKPMIQCVIENIVETFKETETDFDFYLLCQKEHIEKYHLNQIFHLLFSELNDVYDLKTRFWIVPIDGITEGAACTTLFAKDAMDVANQYFPLLIANSDQIFEIDTKTVDFSELFEDEDGVIFIFPSIHPKWSFTDVDKSGRVKKVAEKDPISNRATVGVYWWKKTSDYFKYAEQMIEKDIRTNNEFYVCPVYNEAIQDKKKIYDYPVVSMHGLGTPEDLNLYVHRMMIREELSK